ncbi:MULTISPECIES: DUF3313 domain-containing protein [Paraburkholderia]|uniref:DUF3313 domain-containing protein n=1 Tax=Paraburkholderia TaxID=1822464 RepID=UPI002AB7E0D8|nr:MULTISPECIES: DUF3313 domain-containing protein [Paraburkholderia]
MTITRNVRHLLFALSFLSLAGCAGVQPVAYSGIPSSSYLKANAHDDTGRIPYNYSTTVNWQAYSRVIVDTVTVYNGADSQFGDMSDADRATLAIYLQKSFTQRLGTRFVSTTQPGRGTLRVKLILTGAETTKPVLGQFTHFDIGGNVYNGVQAVRGGKAMFGGSVSYAVEIYDASNNKLLNAYVTRQYPNAMNLVASFGSLGAAKAGIDKGADALVAELR